MLALVSACGPLDDDLVDPQVAEFSVTSGSSYVLANKLTNLCLGGDLAGPVAQDCHGGWTSQQLVLTNLASGYWQIKHPYSGKCLGDNKTILEWETCNTSWWSQDWEALAWGPVNSAHFGLRNRHSGLALSSTFSNSLSREAYNSTYWSQAWETIAPAVSEVSLNPHIDKKCITRYKSRDNAIREFVYPVAECADPWGKGLIYYDSAEKADQSFAPRLPLHLGAGGDWGTVLQYGLTSNGPTQWTAALGTDYFAYKPSERHLLNWLSISDEFPAQTVGNNQYYVDFEIRFAGSTNEVSKVHNNGYDATPAYHSDLERGKSRVTLGIHGLYDNAKDIWLEWVLWNSSGAYDGCQPTGFEGGSWWGTPPTSPCDTSVNKYDRRNWYGTGETKYFSPNGISLLSGIAPMPVLPTKASTNAAGVTTYPATSTWYSVRFPITKAFKNDPTGWYWLKDYNLLKIDQAYLGVESHGKVKTLVYVRNWRVYRAGP